jgi:hypothetical protein
MIKDRENTLVVSARIDARDLATIIKAWEIDVGGRPRSTSWLVREVIGAMADLMEQRHGQAVKIESHQHAYEVVDGANLSAHSTRSLRAITKGMQSEGLAAPIAEGPKEIKSDELLLRAIRGLRSQGKSEEEITERIAPLAEKFESEDAQKERARLDAEKQAHRDQIEIWHKQDQARKQEPEITPEQKTANFEASVVKELGNEWEGPIHKIVIENTRKNYMQRTPEATEAEFDAWLLRMVERAKPEIDTRAQRNADAYEVQERERAARKEAREAVAR